MHEDRSKIMNSSIFSCGVIAPAGHSAGNVFPVDVFADRSYT
jgi:hypothetical protein